MSKSLQRGRSEKRQKPASVYTYFQALFMSFYSTKLYVDVKQRWRGLGFRYLFLLAVIFSIPWGLFEYVKEHQFYTEVAIPTMKKLPDMTVKNGDVIFDKKMPFFIKGSEGKTRIIIDTTGKIKTLSDTSYPGVILLITKNQLISHFPKMPVDVQHIQKNMSGMVTATIFLQAMDKAKKVFLYTLYPVMVLSLFSALCSVMALFGFVAMFCSKSILKYDLTYRDSIKVTSVASTPMLLLFFTTYLRGWAHQSTGLLLFFVLLAYYIFAMRANKQAAKQLIPI